MSETHAPRGRGSARGGRGAFRGGRGGARVSKSTPQENTIAPSYEDEGELGQLKKKHSSNLLMIKELFPDWTDEDLVFALEDADGVLEIAIERISEGNVSQWGEVKKKHADRPRTKPKEALPVPSEPAVPSSRGGRTRGSFEGRGRARGERGRGGRGGRGSHSNGVRSERPATHVPEVAEVSPVPADSWEADGGAKEVTEKPVQDAVKAAAEQSQKSSLIPEGTKKGWASLFAKPTPAPQTKPPPPAAMPLAEKMPENAVDVPSTDQAHLPLDGNHVEATQTPEAAVPEAQVPQIAMEKKEETAQPQEQSTQVPPPSATDSTMNTIDDHAQQHQQQQQQQQLLQEQQLRPAVPYAPTAAYKTTPGRSHFQRRLLDQQEAVVMPGNHAVDRAAVQFGSMGLNGSADDVDIDEQREEAETRPQPPQHSPIAPRASLPPSTRPPVSGEAATPRAAPGLPPVPSTTADSSFNDFSRYGEPQKPYDPFGQQVEQPQPQSQPQAHPQAQEPFSNQATLPSQATATTGADYSAFYANDQSRNPYYYGGYGQPQEVATQRVTSSFGAAGIDAPVQPSSSQAPGRYGHVEATNSGQNTPNPTLPGQTQPNQPTHMPQAQGHGAFNYGYPYYSNPHYPNTYISQMGQQHQYGRNRPMYDDVRRYEEHYLPHSNQFGYGSQYAPYGGKGGMYGQPQHAFSYEHSSSPANAGGFGQGVPARDASYGRTGSAQPGEGQQSTGNNAFGGIPDVFGRAQSGFNQNQPVASQQPVSGDDGPKAFETSKAGGPSPSVSHANRPGSDATNSQTQPAGSQAGLPPVPGQQGSQQAFGNYPHLNPQYGGLGGLGTHHQTGATQTHHQAAGYGNYGGGFGSNYYGNTGRGGGWGGNYGH
ncbi:RNAPII degradation factor [Ophidiomyces ophidiicola]|nr:RNAPII degradation factor [Ophidiomyces ophidiicola]